MEQASASSGVCAPDVEASDGNVEQRQLDVACVMCDVIAREAAKTDHEQQVHDNI